MREKFALAVEILGEKDLANDFRGLPRPDQNMVMVGISAGLAIGTAGFIGFLFAMEAAVSLIASLF